MDNELDDYDWKGFSGNQNYGAISSERQQQDEFDGIKISLGGDKKASYNAKQGKSDDLEEAKKEMRKTDISTGEGSGANKSKDDLSPEEFEQRANRCCNCIHIDYYTKYFDVTTHDVLRRLFFSLNPFSDKLLQAIGENADLYGPFWIYTSMIFLLAFAENMHNYLAVGSNEFAYDFANIPPSFLVVYGVGFGVPLGLSFLMKCMNDAELKF
jgi:hypothetical protein